MITKSYQRYIIALFILITFVLGGCESSRDAMYNQSELKLSSLVIEKNNINVSVDARVELLSIVQYISDYDDRYNLMTKFNFPYKEWVEEYFSDYKNHRAVKEFNKLAKRGFSYDAPPALMLYLTEDLRLREDVEVTDYLISRAGGKSKVNDFIKALREFAIDTDFQSFYQQNLEYYEGIITNTLENIEDNNIIKEIEDYYGWGQNSYNIILTSLFHRGGFGPSVDAGNNKKDIYSIIGPSGIAGVRILPTFGSLEEFNYLQRHEFSHSFVNPTTELFKEEATKFEKLYKPIEKVMEKQAYGNWITTLNEHIVRAVTTRLAFAEGESQGQKALNNEKDSGFIYIDALLEKLVIYEENRDLYPDLISFYPILLEALEEFE